MNILNQLKMTYENKSNTAFETFYNELLKSAKGKELEFVKNWKYLLYIFFLKGFESKGED